jgi:DNA-binding NarL/FixJ family response regulator
VRVLIADDQALVRAGIRKLLETDPGIVVTGEAADGVEALAHAAAQRPDVIVMDIRMPRLDGLEATRQLLARDPRARVLILTTFALDEYVYEALRAGASGFLLKDAPPEHLLEAVHVIAAGDALLSPQITRTVIREFSRGPGVRIDLARKLDDVTPRERQILDHIAHGLTNDEIAARLIVSRTTVKTHVASLLAKLAARDRVQLVIFAYESGALNPSAAADTPND